MSAAPHRAPEGEEPRDRGVSLAELVVTLGIMALIGTMVMVVAVTVLKTFVGIQPRLDNSNQAQLGMAAAGKVLRTAIMPAQLEDTACVGCTDTAILTANKTTITFYANLGSTVGPSLVTLKVVQDTAHAGTAKLVQDTQPPIALADNQYKYCDRAQPSCKYATHTLARGLLWPTPGIFTYYDYEGIAINQTTLSSSNLPRVSSVDLVIAVKTDPSGDYPARTAVSRVRLPNVEINVLTETST